MAILIKEIVSDLVDSYPEAMPTDIFEAIIEGVESEETVAEIVSSVQLPTPTDNLLYDLIKSRRLNRKQVVQSQEKRELFALLTNVQAHFASLGDQSYSRPLISRDGAKVASATSFRLSGSSSIKSRTVVTETVGPPIGESMYLKLVKETPVQNIGDFVIPVAAILQYIGEKVERKQRLSFEDTAKLNSVWQLIDEEVVQRRLLTYLERDVQLRNEIFHINCINGLYKGEDLLPIELRTEQPSAGDVRSLIDERIAAITVHEYRLLHNLAGDAFIKGEITYDEYINQTNEYAKNANKLCPQQYR